MRIILNIKLKSAHADPVVTPRLDFSSHDTVAEHNYGLKVYRELLEVFKQDAIKTSGTDEYLNAEATKEAMR